MAVSGPSVSSAAPALKSWELGDGHSHYELVAADGPEGLTVEVTGADNDGRVIARVRGHLPALHLPMLVQLLLTAAADPHLVATHVVRVPTPRSGGAGQGAAETPDAPVVAGVGRAAGGVRHEPREAKTPHTPAYTMEDLRRVHPNSHKPWRPEDDARLAERAAQGATVNELMSEFGRNRGAIAARLNRVLPPSRG
ncbi:hypothetical protein ACFO1B_05930 [Dactylosporangium siamense]|uniref:Uncharacterized protein n=1 Tax=Dactylosporangium siamense TaxID=685454 RepID=A0A919PIS9_9ACTN|nr:hypothetical protein [Dactylosporangium siamense]GIG43295.1 hypothetical protein Dsi01nite_013360 [Dactylosporangium siamense]